MTKKDRIAMVFSIIYFPLTIQNLMSGDTLGFVMGITPLTSYWGYRFIKDDISFLSSKGKNNE